MIFEIQCDDMDKEEKWTLTNGINEINYEFFFPVYWYDFNIFHETTNKFIDHIHLRDGLILEKICDCDCNTWHHHRLLKNHIWWYEEPYQLTFYFEEKIVLKKCYSATHKRNHCEYCTIKLTRILMETDEIFSSDDDDDDNNNK